MIRNQFDGWLRSACAVLAVALVWPSGTICAQVVINEFMAVNDGAYTNRQGLTPDWIELYNNDRDPHVLGRLAVDRRREQPVDVGVSGLEPSGLRLRAEDAQPPVAFTCLREHDAGRRLRRRQRITIEGVTLAHRSRRRRRPPISHTSEKSDGARDIMRPH